MCPTLIKKTNIPLINIYYFCHTKANIVRLNLFKGKSYSPTTKPELNVFSKMNKSSYLPNHHTINCLLYLNNASPNSIQNKINILLSFYKTTLFIMISCIYLFFFLGSFLSNHIAFTKKSLRFPKVWDITHVKEI